MQRRMIQMAGWLALVVGLVACGGETTSSVTVVSPSAALSALESSNGGMLLDIRTPEEVSQGRIPGATNIDFYDPGFRASLAELDRDATYVVYCRSGNRSSQAIPIFEELGFSDVTMVDGGILAWLESGLPVEP